MMNKFHFFKQPIDSISLPDKFTYPFHYTPHPLCILAAEELQEYLNSQDAWKEELQKGKMFGVLVVQNKKGELGYIAAFSGILAGKNLHPYFVPPVYNLQKPTGYFKQEEEQISAINKKVEVLLDDPEYLFCKQQWNEEKLTAQSALQEMKEDMVAAKKERERLRANELSEQVKATLIRESQFQKAEFKRLKQYWEERLHSLQTKIETFEKQIEELRTERKKRSVALQLWLFRQFQLLNAKGEKRDLCELFKDTAQQIPPAGAGECAAPKLLQYAYLNGWHPIAMAEFWWGDSPKQEIRRHGYYYPACKGKCEPILKHMLVGLQVEQNPLLNQEENEKKLEIVYEDEWLLVVNKPAGMLSVPGKMDTDSVFQRMSKCYPDATGPLIVHRLDMATSGLLLIAKTKEVHQHLQAQFKNRTIEKRYIAILDGWIKKEKGSIELPLRPEPNDRPRQVVDEKYGKPAITRYQVIEQAEGKTRIVFFPLTGRTHQLRVHAAHPDGLNTPILGDELYGKKAERLYLHAEYIAFQHPITNKKITVEKKAGF